ncbi:HAMP domain-containing histidine kinase [Paenibacillus oenotherae]|uniref:histidine kinase n=1 Tax=Paenibacillus oenotherae TaxID=1435645 RepID=A0ABS7DCQ8_9BACL|nr:HAMP domain-containing sensor histidine kinase [Paenibacillus oenotherae]MBW7477655.1 HAMP domain-containing histidine kinase [Paenibacillus oenotherae]
MLYAFILTLTIGLVITFAGNRTPTAKGAAYLMFAAAAGCLGRALEGGIIKSVVDHELLPLPMIPYLVGASEIGIAIGIYALPCCYVNYAYASWGVRAASWWVKIGLRLHWVLAALLVAYHGRLVPVTLAERRLNLAVVATLVIGASIIIVVGYIRERNPVRRRNRLEAMLLFVPLMMINLFIGYVGAAFGFKNMFLLNTVLITLFFMWFIVFAIKRGLFGLRLRLERQLYSSAISGLGTGVSQLNHAIKNQASLLVLFGDRLKQISDNPTKEQLLHQAELIAETGHHLAQWTDRIHAQTQEIILQEEQVNLASLIEYNLTTLSGMGDDIHIVRDYTIEPLLHCDPTHLKETIANIIINASEAMGGKGTLTIRICESGKWLILSFEDTGHGMDASQQAKVLQPFYTTKRNPGNYGLGLSYCFQVMERHRGELRLCSKAGQGTVVSLCFSLKRMKKQAAASLAKGEPANRYRAK